MVYRYIVVSEPLDLNYEPSRRTGIDTAILYVNSQIYKEASNVLYTENRAYIGDYGRNYSLGLRDCSGWTKASLQQGVFAAVVSAA